MMFCKAELDIVMLDVNDVVTVSGGDYTPEQKICKRGVQQGS